MNPIKRFLLMVLLTCMWSPSFLFIKYAIHEIPPLTTVSLRVSLAALVFSLILFFKKIPLPWNFTFWSRMTLMALFSSIFPFCLFCFAEESIDSALAAILNGTTPMFTALLAQIFVPSDRMNSQKLFGITLSMFGLILLFAPQLLVGVNGTTFGMIAGTLAAFSYSLSHIYGKLFTSGHPPFVAPTAQFLLSSLILWPMALWYDQSWTLPFPSVTAIEGVLGLTVFGTICAFMIYYKLLDHCGPTAISTVACFFPVGGMLLGFFFLGESFSYGGLFAATMILLGMLTVNEVVSFNFLLRPVSQKE